MSQCVEDNVIIQGPVPAARPYAKQHSEGGGHMQIYDSHLILPLRGGRPNITNGPSVIVVCVLARTRG